MVVEGVHLVPGMLNVAAADATVVECVLTIEDEAKHADHFWIRDAASGGERPVKKYLDRLDDIRRLQDYIVERARDYGVPVIENSNKTDDRRRRDRARARERGRAGDRVTETVEQRTDEQEVDRRDPCLCESFARSDRACGARGGALARPRRCSGRRGGGDRRAWRARSTSCRSRGAS